MPLPVTISIDLVFFLRVFGAFCWGVLFALFLQYSRLGQFWTKQRTWVAVVIGVGVDLAISFNGEWFTVLAVIAASSVGIIARSLVNEEKKINGGFHRNKVIWNIEDATALSNDLVELLNALLNNGKKDTRSLEISRALSLAYQIREKCKAARRGEYEQ